LWFSSSIDLVAWPEQWEDSREEFQKKRFGKAGEITNHKMGAKKSKQHSSINFPGGFIEGISYICIANLRGFFFVAQLLNFPLFASRRCPGHLAMSNELGNDRLITALAPSPLGPLTVSKILANSPTIFRFLIPKK